MERRENSPGGGQPSAVKSLECGLGQNWAQDPALTLLSHEPMGKLLKINAGGQTTVYLTGIRGIKLENSCMKKTKPHVHQIVFHSTPSQAHGDLTSQSLCGDETPRDWFWPMECDPCHFLVGLLRSPSLGESAVFLSLCHCGHGGPLIRRGSHRIGISWIPA